MTKLQFRIPAAFIYIILTLNGCSPDKKVDDKAPAADSVKLKDSLARVKNIEVEEKKAIANIQFEISEQQFDQELTKFKSTLEHNEFQTTYAIDQYLFSSFAGSFHNDSLYKITALGDFIPVERYREELLPQVEALKTSITKTHGPAQAGHGAPESTNTQKGFSYTAYSWNIGSKKIEIKVANRGLYFSCDLLVYQPDVANSAGDNTTKAKT